MQRRGSAFNGFTVEATDGHVGVVTDILFEEKTWALRWFVIDTDPWWSRRQILIHPSAMERPDILGHRFSINLTKLQVDASPGIQSDKPVSRQMEQKLDIAYGYGPGLDVGSYGGAAFGTQWDGWLNQNGAITRAAAVDGDPRLRSMNEVKGYRIHALDGEIGHLTDFLIDDESWKIDSVLIATMNWWPAKHVLLPAPAITEISWQGQYLRVDQTRYNIKSSLPWTESDWSERNDA